MKQTRKIVISDKVFSAEDLRRIANILEKNKELNNSASTQYEVTFSNRTSLETDSPQLFSDESLNGPGRPEAIQMSVGNYTFGKTTDRQVRISLQHGDSDYNNLAVVSSSDETWVSETFLALQEALERVQPQTFWFRSHKTLLLNLIALGIGSLGMLIMDLVGTLFIAPLLSGIKSPFPPDSPWRQFISALGPLLYIAGWLWRYTLGLTWGAFAVRDWFLSLWPSVEFRFGLAHLQTERLKRQRLRIVLTLIILPVLTNLIADLIQRLR